MTVRFSIATNEAGLLEEKHFGEADKFLIYDLVGEDLVLVGEEKNIIKHELGKDFDLKEHGPRIMEFLKDKDINILISMHFSDHVKRANEFFIPVIVSHRKPEDVVNSIKEHLYWIIEEWKKNPSDFSLFTINRGVLKSHIKK